MLKIYGIEPSSNVNKVRFTANALGLEYELNRVNLFEGEHKTQEFLNINPVGKVPVIQDGDFTLFESGAISKYLADKESSSLYPKDVRTRAVVDQWIDFSNIHVQGAFSRVAFNRLLAPMVGEEVDENSLNFGLRMLDNYLPILDNQLSMSKYLTGDEITIADINLLAILDPAEVTGIDITKYKHLNIWFNELKQKDFYTKCHSDFKEAFASISGG